jgi:aryl-alcohol dehydrogenase-like predicted oxidoreductase
MEFRALGRTGLHVSRLSFGTAALAELSPQEGGELLIEAFKLGVNLWDSASDYGTYPHMHWALKHVPREEVILVTKTYAENAEQTKRDVKAALQEIGTNFIDILMLHYTRPEWLGQPPRLPESLLREKDAGRVRILGLSTHSVATVLLAAKMPEVEVVETIVNPLGKFRSHQDGKIEEIEDGSIEEMLDALRKLHDRNIGVIAMKVLGHGLFEDDPAKAITFVAVLPQVDTLCLGMTSPQQIEEYAQVIAAAEGSKDSPGSDR